MKILFVDCYRHIGGGQIVAVSIIKSFVDQGFFVGVMTPQDGPFYGRLQGLGVGAFIDAASPELTDRKKGLNDFFKLICFTVYLRKFIPHFRDYHFIYVNDPRMLFPVFLYCVLLSKQMVFHIHLYHGIFMRGLIALTTRFHCTRYLIANSKFINDAMLRMPFVKSSKVRLVENCLSTVFGQSTFVNRFETAGVSIGMFGRISEEKGFDVAIDLSKKFNDWNFYVVGDALPSDMNYFEWFKKNAPSNIRFLSGTRDIRRIIDEMRINICLVPSRCEESFGMVAIEAMGMSCFTIVAHRGGLINIADATGAKSFKSMEALVGIAKWIQGTARQQLSAETENMYQKTMQIYNIERFKRQMGALFS